MNALERLFERRLDEDRRRTAPYRTVGAELDAVRAGRKAMAMFPLARPGEEEDDDAFLRRLLRDAGARGLGVLVEPGELAGGVTAYVLRAEEGWRVPAIAALWRAALEEGWSYAAERQMSDLLGYDARQRRIWIAQLRHRVAAWGARTVYALLEGARRDEVERLGRRCFGACEGLVLFVHGRGHAPRRDAWRSVAKGSVLARVGLEEAAYARLFGRRTGRVIEARVTARTAAVVARGLRSNVEVLTAAGWR